MRKAIHKKTIRVLAVLLALILLFPLVASAATSRYAQNATFQASGSPLVNPNFTSNQWNKWEIVAWGVFLSNFVVPMLDSYESAFSTGFGGSNGSGYKALDFSQASDANNNGIMKNFLTFAIDQSKGEFKNIHVTYQYLDSAGNVIEDDGNGKAKLIAEEKNPIKQPDVAPVDVPGMATFKDVLLTNIGDSSIDKGEILTSDSGGWFAGVEYSSKGGIFDRSPDDLFGTNVAQIPVDSAHIYTLALPPAVSSSYNSTSSPASVSSKGDGTATLNDIAVAKLPVLWVQGADQNWIKVWDMLDPWDFQVAVTMLAKEVNSNSAIDDGLTQKSTWEIVADNIGKAFEQAAPIKMDCFGNIVAILDGQPVVVIPAAYNKHITTEPMVNLVNSLFLTGPTSGVSGAELLKNGKQAVKSKFYWLTDENETAKDNHSDYGAGTSAFSWSGKGLPNNAVALYFDSDSFSGRLYHDVQTKEMNDWTSKIKYTSQDLSPLLTTNYGVLDADLYGNRQYMRGNRSDYIVPKIELVGISKAAGLGKVSAGEYTGKNDGLTSLMVLLSYNSTLVNILPAAYNEAKTSYVDKMTWSDAEKEILDSPVVIPVALKAGTNVKKNTSWAYLARDFVDYYGTTYYPANKGAELARASKAKNWLLLTKMLMYSDSSSAGWWDDLRGAERLSAPVLQHASTPAMQPYMNSTKLGNAKMAGFVWRVNDYINKDKVDDGATSAIFDEGDYYYLTQRWVKAYPTNKILTEVASYLGMRGNSEFNAAAAPYVYFSYLKIYGVDKVLSFKLNENPTKFNENLFNAAALFEFNPTDKVNIKSDEEKKREVTSNMWMIMSPTEGNEYRRELLAAIVGDFVYDQYNRAVFGGSLEYRSGGVQQVVTRSQTGFLRFPSLDDNMFTRWFFNEYSKVALWLLGVGLAFIIGFGILRKRKVTWFFVSVILLVSSVILIPFTNDMASRGMDGLVSNIMKDKATTWSMSEMLADARAEKDFLSTGLSAEEAEVAADIMRDLSIVYTDRTLVLRQDISRKAISLGNYSELQQFASTRWALPSLMRQFSADDGSLDYLYVPLLDVADNAANAYWWYNPKDATKSGGIAGSDKEAKYAVGTKDGQDIAQYTQASLQSFYPAYFSGNADIPVGISEPVAKSYRSITSSLEFEPIHNYIYMLMHNTYAGDSPYPLIPAGSRPLFKNSDINNTTYWGDPKKLDEAEKGGAGTFLSLLPNTVSATSLPALNRVSSSNYNTMYAHAEMVQLLQQYSSRERDTMTAELPYIWSTETLYPYFYALVKDTMYTYSEQMKPDVGADSGEVIENSWNATDDKRLGVIVGGLQGEFVNSQYYGDARNTFMHQSGIAQGQLNAQYGSDVVPDGNSDELGLVYTGYGRDVLDLESVFKNVVPYMYQMTIITGGLTGEHENDKGLFGDNKIKKSEYQMFEGLPHSWFYRSNWVSKIVEAPAYNKKETIGYWSAGVKKTGSVSMTYLPDAYLAAGVDSTGSPEGREMVFSEAQMKMMNLSEADLSTLELKLIRLNKDVTERWTSLLNYINTPGLTSEVMVRQMALEALTAFNSELTPPSLGNGAYSLYPSSIDLRALSFDTLMRVILLNATKDSNYFNADAMEIVVLEYDIGTGILLLVTTWLCVYGVTLLRAFFLAFLFLMGAWGVAKSVFAANNSKKATLLGYVTNIGLLFAMSFVYYFIFNLLMTGANDAAYVGTEVSGVSVAPAWAILTILIASIAYMVGMVLMFKIALKSVIAGTGDLGYGVYKDKAQAGYNKFSRNFRDMQSSHLFEDLQSGASVSSAGTGSVSGGMTTNQAGGAIRRRRSSAVSDPGSGSGSRALQGNHSTRRAHTASAMEDHSTLDNMIDRGGQSTPQQPAMNLSDYQSTAGDKKKT